MPIELSTPAPADLDRVALTLREWWAGPDAAAGPLQLHVGDLGWFWRAGTEATAAAVRVWTRGDDILAAGLLDGADLLRLALAPGAGEDAALAEQLFADLTDPDRGILGRGEVFLEAPAAGRLRELLSAAGWVPDEPWTPLRRDLTEPVPDGGLRIEIVTADRPEVLADRIAIQRAAFDNSSFTDELWSAMAGGRPYADARCLVGYDTDDNAVAAVTVWSAGPGRPGILEPMGVHRDHRRRGHGRAINLAAAGALRDMGASHALVCTPSSNQGGVASYVSAGYEPQPERLDLARSQVSC